MATLTESQDAYDRHNLHVGMIHSDVADVLLRLEAEIAHLHTDLEGARAALARVNREMEAERAARSRYDTIVHCARAAVYNPVPANITRLAAAIDAVDRAQRET